MNQEVLSAKWPMIRRQAKQWWDAFSDADLDEVAGRRELLAAKIQTVYGTSREEAELDINRFLLRSVRGLGLA